MPKLYHATTLNKYKKYKTTGHINKPVRGFTTPLAAMAWAMKTGRTMILELEVAPKFLHKLPDHHNNFGEAWWSDNNVPSFSVFYSTH